MFRFISLKRVELFHVIMKALNISQEWKKCSVYLTSHSECGCHVRRLCSSRLWPQDFSLNCPPYACWTGAAAAQRPRLFLCFVFFLFASQKFFSPPSVTSSNRSVLQWSQANGPGLLSGHRSHAQGHVLPRAQRSPLARPVWLHQVGWPDQGTDLGFTAQ